MRVAGILACAAAFCGLLIGTPMTAYAQTPVSAGNDNRWVVPYVGLSVDRGLDGDAQGLILGTYIVRRWESADWRMLNIAGVITSDDAYVRFETGANLSDGAGRILGLAAGMARLDPGQVFAAVFGGIPVRVGSFEFFAEGRVEMHRREGRHGVAALLTIGVPLLR